MSEQIKIDSGLKTYDVVDKERRLLCQITFNPSDTGIAERYEEVKKQLTNLKKDFGKRAEKKTLVEQLKELDSIVYEKIDYLLGAEVSASIFSIMGPFSPLSNGQFFFENVLAAITQIIQSESNENREKLNKKIIKHTKKYHN